MQVNDLYYNKYLKYKTKYLDLKSQLGDSLIQDGGGLFSWFNPFKGKTTKAAITKLPTNKHNELVKKANELQLLRTTLNKFWGETNIYSPENLNLLSEENVKELNNSKSIIINIGEQIFVIDPYLIIYNNTNKTFTFYPIQEYNKNKEENKKINHNFIYFVYEKEKEKLIEVEIVELVLTKTLKVKNNTLNLQRTKNIERTTDINKELIRKTSIASFLSLPYNYFKSWKLLAKDLITTIGSELTNPTAATNFTNPTNLTNPTTTVALMSDSTLIAGTPLVPLYINQIIHKYRKASVDYFYNLLSDIITSTSRSDADHQKMTTLTDNIKKLNKNQIVNIITLGRNSQNITHNIIKTDHYLVAKNIDDETIYLSFCTIQEWNIAKSKFSISTNNIFRYITEIVNDECVINILKLVENVTFTEPFEQRNIRYIKKRTSSSEEDINETIYAAILSLVPKEYLVNPWFFNFWNTYQYTPQKLRTLLDKFI